MNAIFSDVLTVSPIVSLQLGNSLDPNNIKEGDDVYFECRVRSNPLQRRIFWHHNVSSYLHKTSLHNSTLLIVKINSNSNHKLATEIQNPVIPI